MLGTIFDIKRFSVHDGPGLRTTVFLKGCPLTCLWCQNPEGLSREIALWYFPNKCISCGRCIEACPNDALRMEDGKIIIDRDLCRKCGSCTKACPTNALAFDGRVVSVDEVMEEVLKDRQFYETSGGGITLSGGDALGQHRFAGEIMKRCKEEGIHTAMESCMFATEEQIASVLPYLDYLIMDVKHHDSSLHSRYTGVSNERILKNLKDIAAVFPIEQMLVRIPLIPGYTADPANVKAIAAKVFAIDPGLQIELINYNPLAPNKYRILQKDYVPGTDLKPLSEQEISDLYAIIEEERRSTQ